MTLDQANAVFDILVAECGAHESLRDEFTYYLRSEQRYGHEFRFQGNLGFGGKLHANRSATYVSCYPEDRTADRVEAITRANSRIKEALHDG